MCIICTYEKFYQTYLSNIFVHVPEIEHVLNSYCICFNLIYYELISYNILFQRKILFHHLSYTHLTYYWHCQITRILRYEFLHRSSYSSDLVSRDSFLSFQTWKIVYSCKKFSVTFVGLRKINRFKLKKIVCFIMKLISNQLYRK